MTFLKSAKITNRGMVSIPAALRKKYNIHDGDRIVFIEEEDGLKMHVIQLLEELRKKSYTTEEMLEEMRKSRKEELEMEY
ncbi:MAG: AbrB/MazE/SpoVT family DNA-binding domain-containing protein [Promethearchaeota archaeon]